MTVTYKRDNVFAAVRAKLAAAVSILGNDQVSDDDLQRALHCMQSACMVTQELAYDRLKAAIREVDRRK